MVPFAIKYLRHYGYLAAEAGEEALSAAVLIFQHLFEIQPTGLIDTTTLAAMELPRCGLPDVLPIETEEVRWRKNRLNYYVEQYLTGHPLSPQDQDDIFRVAWKSWEDYADIRLSPVLSSHDADVILSIGSGPIQGFDGPGRILAWSELPQGDDRKLLMRFDASEPWGTGIKLLNVAAHEFGHLLGLDHSHRRGALMAPYYSPSIAAPQPDDDIPRIQSLYGISPAVPLPPLEPIPAQPNGDKPMDREELRKRLQFYLLVASGLAKVTPTEIDDKVVAILNKMVGEEWFLELLIFLLKRFGTSLTITSEQLAMAIQEFHSKAT